MHPMPHKSTKRSIMAVPYHQLWLFLPRCETASPRASSPRWASNLWPRSFDSRKRGWVNETPLPRSGDDSRCVQSLFIPLCVFMFALLFPWNGLPPDTCMAFSLILHIFIEMSGFHRPHYLNWNPLPHLACSIFLHSICHPSMLCLFVFVLFIAHLPVKLPRKTLLDCKLKEDNDFCQFRCLLYSIA